MYLFGFKKPKMMSLPSLTQPQQLNAPVLGLGLNEKRQFSNRKLPFSTDYF